MVETWITSNRKLKNSLYLTLSNERRTNQNFKTVL